MNTPTPTPASAALDHRAFLQQFTLAYLQQGWTGPANLTLAAQAVWEGIEQAVAKAGNAAANQRLSSPWRRLTPEEYAQTFTGFPPHRAEITMAINGVSASAEVLVFLVPVAPPSPAGD